MKDFKVGARESLPIGMGYLPLSIAFGMMLVQLGGHWSLAPLLSALIFSGTLQYMIVPMLAVGAPLLDFFVTALIVNSRLLFYGLGYPVHKFTQKRSKWLAIFTLTDETYSLMTSEKANSFSEKQVVWVHLIGYLYWIGGSAIGALLATRLPNLQGLEFSLTALMVVLCMEQGYSKKHAFPFVLGFGSAFTSHFIWPEQFLLSALSMTLLGLAIAYRLNRAKAPMQEVSPS